jgi:hypothetical protein
MVLALNCETMLCRGSIYDLPPSWNIGEQQAAPIRVQSTLPYMSQVEKMGPEGPPQRPGERFGRKMGPEGPPRRQGSVCVKDGRFSDGTFPIRKVTFLCFRRTAQKKIKKNEKNANQ